VPLVHKLVRIHSKNKDGSLKMSLNGGRNQDQSSIQDLHSDLGRTEKRKVGGPIDSNRRGRWRFVLVAPG
jgi:hypothetical protein